jgi:hypothetical protein
VYRINGGLLAGNKLNNKNLKLKRLAKILSKPYHNMFLYEFPVNKHH